MIERIKDDLLKNISEDRYNHTLRVANICEKLAIKYKEDLQKTIVAALLHDSAKFISQDKIIKMARKFELVDEEIYLYSPELIHGPLASKMAKDKYDIIDKDILNAIRYHTTGRRNMSLLEKIIFIGDFIEPSRNFKGIDKIRDLAFEDIDRSILLALNKNIKFLITRGETISINSIDARNYLIEENIKKRR